MSEFNDKFNKIMDTPDSTGEYDSQDIHENKAWAFLACTGVLFFVPLVACPNSKFGRFWANQGLILLIVDIVLSLCARIINIIPVIEKLIGWIPELIISIYLITAIVYVAQGKAKELPIVGGILHVFDK